MIEKTLPAARDNGCLHKFVGTKVCLMCGWRPCEQCRGHGVTRASGAHPIAAPEDCSRCLGTGDEPITRTVEST